MASVVAICNMALAHVGSDATIASISPPDRSAEAGHCARFYDMARTELLEAGAWTFAKTRIALAEAASNPSSIWTYAYILPSDVLSPLRVLQMASVQDFVMWPFSAVITVDELQAWSERGSAQYEIEGGYASGDALLLTHEPEAVLLYVRDVTDPGRFSATFTSALGYLLGSYIAGPILRGVEGAKAAQTLRQVAYNMLARAGVQDANSSRETSEFVPDSIRRR